MFFKYIFKCKKIFPLIYIKWRSFLFRATCKLGWLPNILCFGNVIVVQSLRIQGKGKVTLNDGCRLGVYPSPGFFHGEFYLEARDASAEINIGQHVYINNNAVIIADKTSISIGDNTLIGPNFICFDSNFHPLDPTKRLSDDYRCSPVNIGSNVLIGINVTVLKGVNIGDNSVISAGAIITEDVPANVVVKSRQGVEFHGFK